MPSTTRVAVSFGNYLATSVRLTQNARSIMEMPIVHLIQLICPPKKLASVQMETRQNVRMEEAVVLEMGFGLLEWLLF